MLKSEVYIGPAGWSYPDWNGIVYPRRKPRGFDPLAYIASYFNLIEINSTFYRIPTADTCRSWAKRVQHNDAFVFSVKAFQEFTHKKAPIDHGDVGRFKKAVGPLYDAGVLSAVLIQFPWSFRFREETRDHVCALTESFSPFPTAVEVRHASWSGAVALDMFREQGMTLCGIDQPIIGDSLEPDVFLPGEAGHYFRLHGRNYKRWFDRKANRDDRYDYLYSSHELTRIQKRIQSAAATPGKVHVVLNNHFRGQAVANALQLKNMIEGTRARAPAHLRDRYPQLAAHTQVFPAPSATDRAQRTLFEEDE